MSKLKDVLSHARILIADDQETNLRLLKRILELAGALNIRTTNDPQRILPLYHEFRPDIVLLDLHMPGTDGFAVMKKLKEVVPPGTFLPILVLTADLSLETKRHALAAGAQDFLTKPLDSTEIVLRITNLLEMRFWHLQAQSQHILLEEQVLMRTDQLEETLARLHTAQAQVIKQERLSALGVMASGIAHDFNNSLTTILGFSELLLGTPDRKQYIETIITAAQDARHIVQRLREFSRVREKTEHHVATSLNETVTAAVDLAQPKWSNQASARGIEVKLKLELEEVPLLSANASELREMLVNLIFNSVDALPRGGTIRIGTRTEESAVVLEVSDNGIGMDAATRDRCLEPFFTSKGEEGTGLGLSIVYGILQRHNATIDIQSQPNLGTTVKIRFPICVDVAGIEEVPEEEEAPQRPLRILAVDDQPTICELVGELLATAGHKVDTVSGGGVALEKCRENNYDVIIADEAMPGIKGQQLASVIKQLTPAQPFILLTGFGDTVREQGCTPSVDLILDKPVMLCELRRAISHVMKNAPAEPRACAALSN